MRNLYKRLNISSSATNDQIRSAIKSCSNAQVKQDATAVLLDTKRRAAYDQLHKTLLTIGALRSELGLSHGDNWYGKHVIDYNVSAESNRSSYEHFRSKIASAKKMSLRGQQIDRVKKFAWNALKISAVIFGLYVAVIAFNEDSSGPANGPKRNTPTFSAPPVLTPTSGTVRRHSAGIPVAPLTVKTSTGANYLLKLQTASSQRDILDVFIRGGDSIELDVPLGGYLVKYATGSTWYGYDHLFGPSTSYSKAESTFNFRQTGNSVSGYTITLYQVSDGNLRTRKIKPGDF